MSLHPANGAHSLGQVLIERAFSRPPRQLVDADLIEALESAGAEPEQTAPPPGPDAAGPQVDVRV